MSKFVVYYRVSTKSQNESGLGLEAQKSYINHFLNENEIVKEFTEIASAKSIDCKKRPLLNEAIEFCVTNGYFLAVAKIDRLSRNTKDSLEICEKLKGKIFACDLPSQKGTVIDTFMLTICIAVAQRERELIGIRTSQALHERIKTKGKWQKKGFNKETLQKANEGKRLAAKENENNRRALLIVDKLRKEGKTYLQIANELNANGYKTSQNKEFKEKS